MSPSRPPRGAASPSLAVALVALVLALAAGAYFLWRYLSQPPQLPPPAAATPAAPAPRTGPMHPMPEKAAAPKPLPRLAESDATMLEALRDAIGTSALAFVFPEDLIRHIVVTIDNLPREHFSLRLSPVRPVGGRFKVEGRDETLAIAPDNSRRYAAYVGAFENLDAARVTALYARLYPLFQQAYMELGFPTGYFNDRLIEVIDHMLAAPAAREQAKLVVPHVLFEYADPELESLSAGQKLLMRIGADNEARVKAKLRQFRGELIALSPPPGEVKPGR